MSGFQQVIVLGRLGGDPEVKYTQGGTAVCRFSLATSRMERVRGSEEKAEKTTWHNVKAFGRQAEVIGEHVKKGDLLFVEGRLDNWKAEAADGSVKYGTDLIVEHFEFAGGRSGRGEEGSERSTSRPQTAQSPRGATRGPTPQRQAASAPAQAPADDLPFEDDDIPF